MKNLNKVTEENCRSIDVNNYLKIRNCIYTMKIQER